MILLRLDIVYTVKHRAKLDATHRSRREPLPLLLQLETFFSLMDSCKIFFFSFAFVVMMLLFSFLEIIFYKITFNHFYAHIEEFNPHWALAIMIWMIFWFISETMLARVKIS